MEDIEDTKKSAKVMFVGPSIGASLICCIPLLVLKLLGIADISWILVLCPIWLGWIVVLVAWLWLSTIHIISISIFKPIYIPVFIPYDREKAEDDTGIATR